MENIMNKDFNIENESFNIENKDLNIENKNIKVKNKRGQKKNEKITKNAGNGLEKDGKSEGGSQINIGNLKSGLERLALFCGEIKRRSGLSIYGYNVGSVVHKKQIEFHKSEKRVRFVFGGNRTGKTECGAVECVYMARGIHPFRKNKPKTEGWVVSLSTRVQKDVAQKKILKFLDPEWIAGIVMQSGSSASPENGVIERILVKNVSGEISTIGFKSVEEGRDKFQGASLDYVWFDEEPPEDVYVECVMRVLDKCGDIFCTMTPLSGHTFVYDKIYLNESNDNEIFYTFFSWADNPFLSGKEIERLKSVMSDDELEAREFGRFMINSGRLVYPEFDENENVIDPFEIPREWQDTISIDPGLNNPLSAHWYAVDPYTGNIYVVAEHFEKGRAVDYHAEMIKTISERLDWKKNCFGGVDALIDSAANQTTLNNPKSVTQLFREFGIFVNPKVNKEIFAGINRIKRLLKDSNGNRHLFIFRTCVNMIREIKGYRWGKADLPVKVDDHSMDELRYFVNHHVFLHPEIVEPKTEIQKDKEKLYRQNNGLNFSRRF